MGVVNETGKMVFGTVRGAGHTVDLCLRTLIQSYSLPKKSRSTLDLMFNFGVKTIPVVAVVAVFSGMILAMQTGLYLKLIGSQTLVGDIVGISMCREMGPFMTGLILAATVGSAIAAEIGTMSVSEEITALEVMSVDPVRYLVLPRVVALGIMCPILTAFSCLLGILGGGLIAEVQLGVDFPQYFAKVKNALFSPTAYFPKNIWVGLFKAWVFGTMIALIGCSAGLRAKGGALGVGSAVQLSVTISVIMVIIMGYIITWFFFVLLGDMI